MSIDRTPARRGSTPSRPTLRSPSFWESREQKAVRELENQAVTAEYNARLKAVVSNTEREIRRDTAEKTMGDIAKLVETARNTVRPDDSYTARHIDRFLEGYVDNEIRRGQ